MGPSRLSQALWKMPMLPPARSKELGFSSCTPFIGGSFTNLRDQSGQGGQGEPVVDKALLSFVLRMTSCHAVARGRQPARWLPPRSTEVH